jgi:hypothetical protein
MATATPVHPTPTLPPAGLAPADWRSAIDAAYEAARAKYPSGDMQRRLESAAQLVLTGGVAPAGAGHYRVQSRSHPGEAWLVNGSCTCQDAQYNAPEGLCGHRLAAYLYRRALRQCEAQGEVRGNARADAQPGPAAFASRPSSRREEPVPPAAACPEALFSITLKGTIGGHEALLTARGQSYEEFHTNVARLTGLLDPVPAQPVVPPVVAPPAAPPTPEGWCAIHERQMTRQSNERGSWWSHPLDDGTWCRGKKKRGA